jgi:hypothetical protein
MGKQPMHIPTEEPATEHVEMKADCAALTTLVLHKLAMAFCTSWASLPHTAPRSLGSSCVLTAPSRHAGGMSARTLTAREARIGRIIEVFIVCGVWMCINVFLAGCVGVG